jgi:hypothetical protein
LFTGPNTVDSPSTSLDLGSDGYIEMAQSWIAECDNHKVCQEMLKRRDLPHSQIPKHLIDVTHTEGPRIVEHISIPQAPKYVALSYVWGPMQTYVLEKSSLEAMKSALDMSRVPQTILDAIKVTKLLGYPFLWIDALCIVQDSGPEMMEEISALGEIYENATVTIIAGNSPSASSGFLTTFTSPEYFNKPFEFPINTSNNSPIWLSLGYRAYYKPFKDPINSRAWTLQERILSRRCLVYSHDGLKWLCQTCEKNPASPSGAPPIFPRMALSIDLIADSGDPVARGEASVEEQVREGWLDMRTEYTSRKLTYGDDKLRAISAIANRVAHITGWTYLAGLWKEYLFLDLHWSRDPQSDKVVPGMTEPINPLSQRPSRYRAPSWSWASIDGTVVDAREDLDSRTCFHFEIISCDISYKGITCPSRFQFEPIESAVLVVSGRIIERGWRTADTLDLADISLLDPEAGVEYICGEANLDAEEPAMIEGSMVRCLAMSEMAYENRKRKPVEGLLLLPQGDSGQFRRIGYFTMFGMANFDTTPQSIVEIV